MINAFKPQSTEDIENRIEELAKSYVPEWKFDRRNPDAGSVIAQIFARQTEENNRLMSQMPERYHIEFVNMIDATLRSAQPSASIVVFNLEGGSTVGTQIPKGTRLSAESDESESGYVVFETGKNIFVTDSRIKSVFMTDAEDGTISPLFGNFDIPDIIAKNQMIIDDEEEEVNGEISDEDIPEIYEPTEVPPFTLFGESRQPKYQYWFCRLLRSNEHAAFSYYRVGETFRDGLMLKCHANTKESRTNCRHRSAFVRKSNIV